jgi:hypothetical protein
MIPKHVEATQEGNCIYQRCICWCHERTVSYNVQSSQAHTEYNKLRVRAAYIGFATCMY